MTVSFNHFSRVFCQFDPPQDFSPFDSKNSCWLGQTGHFEPLSCFCIKSLTFFVGLGIKKNLRLIRHATALRLIPRGLSDSTSSRLNSKNYEVARALADQLQANI